MLLRILTAAVLIPAVVALVWWGPPALLVAAAAADGRYTGSPGVFQFGRDAWACARIAIGRCACAAGIFYAQYVAGSVETLYARRRGDRSSVTLRAGAMSIDEGAADFSVWSVDHRARHAASAARRAFRR